jgi:ABC-type antimicrobial peptide transport system permease subunit
VSQLREEVRALDSDLPIYYAQTLEEAFADARYGIELVGGWFGTLALIAVVLAAVGIFAITGHAVAERTQEIGVRIALGASDREVVWLFMGRTLAQLAFGLTIGLAGALAAGRFLSSLIARTDPNDPITLAAVVALIVGVALAATWLPARRATRIDPIVALRYE